jgi:hypothetical protein
MATPVTPRHAIFLSRKIISRKMIASLFNYHLTAAVSASDSIQPHHFFVSVAPSGNLLVISAGVYRPTKTGNTRGLNFRRSGECTVFPGAACLA